MRQDIVKASGWRQVGPDRRLTIDLAISTQGPTEALSERALINGVMSFYPAIPVLRTSVLTLGGYPLGGPHFTGSLTEEPVPTPICEQSIDAIRNDAPRRPSS
jgi:hypothetical protein